MGCKNQKSAMGHWLYERCLWIPAKRPFPCTMQPIGGRRRHSMVADWHMCGGPVPRKLPPGAAGTSGSGRPLLCAALEANTKA